MPSQAVSAHGSLLQKSDGGGGWITVAELTNIELNSTRDEVDISIHNEPLSFRNYLPGPASSEVNLTCNFLANDPTHDDQTGILSLYMTATKAFWRILWPMVSPQVAVAFVAFPRQFNIPMPAGEAAALQFTTIFRVDGVLTWA